MRRKHTPQHAEVKKPRKFNQFLKIFITAVIVLVVSGVSVAAFALWDTYRRFSDNSVDISSGATSSQTPVIPDFSFEPYPGEVNFLLVGTDECKPEFAHYFGERCEGSMSKSARNDSNLLVHIPADHESATVVSIPRDLMTKIPTCTNSEGVSVSGSSKSQINTAYDRGGLKCVVETIEQLSGWDIPFAAKVNWGGVITITDELGGVDVCVSNGIYDRYTGLSLDPGVHNLKGLEALQFLRTRHGLSDGSDIARISNQQIYMSALLKKIINDGTLNDIPSLVKISGTIVDNVQHSSNLNDIGTLIRIALLLKQIPLQNINFVQLPTVSDPQNRNRVIEKQGINSEFWNGIENGDDVTVKENYNGAIVQDKNPSTTPNVSPQKTQDSETEKSITVPGLNANSDACSNGAG